MNSPQGKGLRQSIANPVRTAVQLTPAVVITEAVDAFIYDLSDRQYSALAGLLLLIFSVGQNVYEEIKGSAFLKEDAPR